MIFNNKCIGKLQGPTNEFEQTLVFETGEFERPKFDCNILTSTKNASLIITDFLAMIYKNEQPPTASLWRGRAMLENDFNLIYR